MALRNGESHIPALIVAYLITRRSLAAEDVAQQLPSGSVLPIVAGPVKGTNRSYPSLEVWCPSFEASSHREIMTYEILMDLHTAPGTTQSDEDTWCAQIRRSFAGSLFQTYLAALGSGDKSGWDLQQCVITGGGILVDGSERRTIRRTTARVRYRSDEFTD